MSIGPFLVEGFIRVYGAYKILKEVSRGNWNSDIRIKDNYGAANGFPTIMWMNQGGESPVYLV